MKKIIIIFIILAVGLTCIIICGCIHIIDPNLQHIEPAEFINHIEGMNSAHWSIYIGQADGKAYILYKRPPFIGKKAKEKVLFTEADKLGEEFMKKLEAGISKK